MNKLKKLKKRAFSLVMALTLMLECAPISPVSAENVSDENTNLPAVNVPFLSGDNSFVHAPSLVTLSNGNLVSAAETRRNSSYDGGGTDIVSAVSSDSGESWSVNYAEYFGDNPDTYNGEKSTAFTLPTLLANGNTVYMLSNLYPYGVALSGEGSISPSTQSAFDDNGNLLLSADDFESYGYYLNLSDYYIYTDDGQKTELYVDKNFNLEYSDKSLDEAEKLTATPTPTPSVDETEQSEEATSETSGEETSVSADSPSGSLMIGKIPFSADIFEETTDDIIFDESSVDEGVSSETDAQESEELTPEPTAEVTVEPTTVPTAEPTAEPTEEPTATAVPTNEPTAKPNATATPTPTPSVSPSATPISDEKKTSNLFFEDSPFKVTRTAYLCVSSSADGGYSWSEPTPLMQRILPNKHFSVHREEVL